MKPFSFSINKKLRKALGRTGTIKTPHGVIQTPAFVTVGTKASVKALTPEQVASLGAQVILANTYHLYLQPGDKLVHDSGGLGKFMNWEGPTMTDSGGFQVFSLGVAFDYGISKFISSNAPSKEIIEDAYDVTRTNRKAKITEDGVEFQSVIDGSTHFLSPEKSIQIQNNIGADMIFALDECTSPHAGYDYLKTAMDRTHRWAKRSLDAHNSSNMKEEQMLLGIIQGGRHKDLREESAQVIGLMDFDGFGIGGSFVKEDMTDAVVWINAILPEEKPRHLLGVGEPSDLFGAVENGCDLFDCVAPTRQGRNGTLYTKDGRINILNNGYRKDISPIEKDCACYTCKHFTRAYICHLFHAKEMLASTLASIHNLHFIIHLVDQMRERIEDGNFFEFKDQFLKRYYKL
jgi:queuine tRNA-ribosyltransferase